MKICSISTTEISAINLRVFFLSCFSMFISCSSNNQNYNTLNSDDGPMETEEMTWDTGCVQWDGPASGNADSNATLLLCREGNLVEGTFTMRGEAGASVREVSGLISGSSIEMHDTGFDSSRPAPRWRHCLTDTYDLTIIDGNLNITGTYESQSCNDRGTVSLQYTSQEEDEDEDTCSGPEVSCIGNPPSDLDCQELGSDLQEAYCQLSSLNTWDDSDDCVQNDIFTFTICFDHITSMLPSTSGAGLQYAAARGNFCAGGDRADECSVSIAFPQSSGVSNQQSRILATHEIAHLFQENTGQQIEHLADYTAYLLWEEWPVSEVDGDLLSEDIERCVCQYLDNSELAQITFPWLIENPSSIIQVGQAVTNDDRNVIECHRALQASFWQRVLGPRSDDSRFRDLLNVSQEQQEQELARVASVNSVEELIESWRQQLTQDYECCPSANQLLAHAPRQRFGRRFVNWIRRACVEQVDQNRAAITANDRTHYPAAIIYVTGGQSAIVIDHPGHLPALCWHNEWLVAAGGRNDPDTPTVVFVNTSDGALYRTDERTFSAQGRPWSDFWHEISCDDSGVTVRNNNYNRTETYSYPP